MVAAIKQMAPLFQAGPSLRLHLGDRRNAMRYAREQQRYSPEWAGRAELVPSLPMRAWLPNWLVNLLFVLMRL